MDKEEMEKEFQKWSFYKWYHEVKSDLKSLQKSHMALIEVRFQELVESNKYLPSEGELIKTYVWDFYPRQSLEIGQFQKEDSM